MLVLRIFTPNSMTFRDERVEKFPCSIGRSKQNDIIIPDNCISSHHATIEKTTKGLMLKDCESKNGIRFEGNKCKELFLRDKSEFYFGDIKIEVLSISSENQKTRLVKIPRALIHMIQNKNVTHEPSVKSSLYVIMVAVIILFVLTFLNHSKGPPTMPFFKWTLQVLLLGIITFPLVFVSKMLDSKFEFKSAYIRIFGYLTLSLAILASWLNLESILYFNLDNTWISDFVSYLFFLTYSFIVVFYFLKVIVSQIPSRKSAVISSAIVGMIGGILIIAQTIEPPTAEEAFAGHISYPLRIFTKENRPPSNLLRLMDQAFHRVEKHREMITKEPQG